jgi:hypothetical protein
MLKSKMFCVFLVIILHSSYALAQIENNDSTTWVEVNKWWEIDSVNIPAYHIDPEEVRNNYYRRGLSLDNTSLEDSFIFSLNGYLQLLTNNIKYGNPIIMIDDQKYYLIDYSKYIGKESRLVVSSEFKYNDKGQIELIVIKTKK